MDVNKKTYLFYLGHPAHYHNISNVINELNSEGHRIILVARSKDVLFDLLKGLPFEIVFLPEKKGKGKLALAYEVIKRQLILFKICKKVNPSLMVGTDIVITHIGKLLKIPSIILNEDDAKEVPYLAKYGFKYATAVFSPECCDISPFEKKKVAYKGYHELAYLHPNYFKPEVEKLKPLNLKGKNFFILRFAQLTAHHDKGKQGIDIEVAKELISLLKPHGKIFITSERKLEKELEPYRIQINPKDIHHVLAFASLYIGDSQTMAAEAAVLGTPSIRFNDFVGKLGYLEELEHEFGLTFGISTENVSLLYEKVQELLDKKDLKKEFQIKKMKMLETTIDVTKLWKDYFKNF